MISTLTAHRLVSTFAVMAALCLIVGCSGKKNEEEYDDGESVAMETTATANGPTLAPQSAKRRMNLLKNGSFENALATSPTLPADWQLGKTQDQTAIQLSPKQGHDNEGQALLLGTTETEVSQDLAPDKVSQLQGAYARVRIWAKAVKGTPKLSMNLLESGSNASVVWNIAAPPPDDDNSNDPTEQAKTTGDVPNNWVKFENVFPIEKDTVKLGISISLNSTDNPDSTETAVLLDDVQIYKTDAPMVAR